MNKLRSLSTPPPVDEIPKIHNRLRSLSKTSAVAPPEEDDRLHHAVAMRDLPKVRALIAEGVDPNGIDEGRTPLHVICAKREITAEDRAMVELLFEAKVDPDIRDQKGSTALHRLLGSQHYDCAQLLMEKGASIEIIDDFGVRPAFAVRASSFLARVSFDAFPLSEYDKQYLSTKIIGQVFGAKGELVHQDRFLPIEGAPPLSIYQFIAEALETFQPSAHTEQFQSMAAAFTRAVNQEEGVAERVKAIQDGELTFFTSGWENHEITLVFVDGYMAICNRGQGSVGYSNIEVFKIDPRQMTEELLLEIFNHKFAPMKEGADFVYHKLPEKLGGTKDDLCRSFISIANKVQKAGYCSFASPVAALRFALGMLHLKEGTRAEALERARLQSKEVSKHLAQYAWQMHGANTLLGFYEVASVPDRVNTKMAKILGSEWAYIVGEAADGTIIDINNYDSFFNS